MKVDLQKTYRTVHGNSVRLSFIDNSIVYGHYETDRGWLPYAWNENGFPPLDRKEINGEIYDSMRLVECKDRRQISTTLYLRKSGEVSLIRDPDVDFGAITINAVIEEGVFDSVFAVSPQLASIASDIRQLAREKEMSKLLGKDKPSTI